MFVNQNTEPDLIETFGFGKSMSPSYNYLLVADVARGDGKDFSTFHIFKLETLEVVGEYQGKPTLDMYANMLNEVGKEFGNCMVVVENNNIGFSVLEKLKKSMDTQTCTTQ